FEERGCRYNRGIAGDGEEEKIPDCEGSCHHHAVDGNRLHPTTRSIAQLHSAGILSHRGDELFYYKKGGRYAGEKREIVDDRPVI
ncbi:MAG: hypothetical protein NTV01_20550, partial [Bacteroidia bacterium]|nr:hypothetical protein [Bacteroidia bacterium]